MDIQKLAEEAVKRQMKRVGRRKGRDSATRAMGNSDRSSDYRTVFHVDGSAIEQAQKLINLLYGGWYE